MWRFIAVAFGVSVISKTLITGVDRFVVYVSRAMALPTGLARATAFGVLAMEAAAACLLLWRRTRWLGGLLAVALLTGFGVFHLFTWGIGDVEPCPCFGPRVIPPGRAGHAIMAALCAILCWPAVASRLVPASHEPPGALSC